MAGLDAFSAQIVKFVREMPDEALLELVKQKLGVHGAGRGAVALPVAPAPAKAKAKRPAKRRTAAAPATEDRRALLDNVERVVKSGNGMSASEVARSSGVPQTRAAAALKELKLAKRIFQGGDRRFARYAGDLKTAELASTVARKSAKGPSVSSPKNGVRPRSNHRRPQGIVAAMA
jgi:hypothetical protein